jgi:hypothetical protein
MTVKEIAEYLSRPSDSIYNALKAMPDAYIDRWVEAQRQAPAEAVWCVIVPPKNCPKPNARLTQLRSVELRNISKICFGFVLTNASPTGRN